MPEAVQGYPKWRGEWSSWPVPFTIAFEELRRAWENQWVRAALLFCAGIAVIIPGQMVFGNRTATYANFLAFMGLLRWAALAIASIMAGPALLDDTRKGALELYHSRGVSRWGYLAGKALAVWIGAFFAIAAPALVYFGSSYLLTDAQPAGWHWMGLGILADAAIFSLVMTSLGLGLSALARSARAATLILFGFVALLDILVGTNPLWGLGLSDLTKDTRWSVLSPLAQMAQQSAWLYPKATPPFDFPFWWGLIGLGLLFALGWAAVTWRQPRLKGVE